MLSPSPLWSHCSQGYRPVSNRAGSRKLTSGTEVQWHHLRNDSASGIWPTRVSLEIQDAEKRNESRLLVALRVYEKYAATEAPPPAG